MVTHDSIEWNNDIASIRSDMRKLIQSVPATDRPSRLDDLIDWWYSEHGNDIWWTGYNDTTLADLTATAILPLCSSDDYQLVIDNLATAHQQILDLIDTCSEMLKMHATTVTPHHTEHVVFQYRFLLKYLQRFHDDLLELLEIGADCNTVGLQELFDKFNDVKIISR